MTQRAAAAVPAHAHARRCVQLRWVGGVVAVLAVAGLSLPPPSDAPQRPDVAEPDSGLPHSNFSLPAGADAAGFCRSWFADLTDRYQMRPLEEALNLTLPERVRRQTDVPVAPCELLVRVSGNALYVHRNSRAAGSYRRRRGWFYCPTKLRVGRLRRLDQSLSAATYTTYPGPPCKSALRGPATSRACCVKTIFPLILTSFQDLMSLLLGRFGGPQLPDVVFPMETADVPWCTRSTSQHTNSSESRLVRVAGGAPRRPRALFVASHSRPHPRFVPHSILLPLSGNQVFTTVERTQVLPSGEQGPLVHSVRSTNATATPSHNPPPRLGEYQQLRKRLPWSGRVRRAVWRGAPTGAPLLQHFWGLPMNTTARRNVLRIAEGSEGLLDVRFGKLPLAELMNHKVVLAVDGHSYASVLKHVLLAGALAVRVGGVPDGGNSSDGGSSYEWFEPLLRSGVHYLRVRADGDGLLDAVRWALSHDGEARAIAERGVKLMQALQHPLSALCYSYSALRELSRREQELLASAEYRGPPGSQWLHLADIAPGY